MQEEEITIPAYESIYRKDKASNRGRILSVKKTIKTITMQVKQGTEGRTVIVDTTKYSKKNKKKKKVDMIYVPQEGVTHNKELYKNSIR